MTSDALPETSQILEILRRSSRGPLKAKEISRELSLADRDYRAFKGRLREMEESGELYRTKGNRYALPAKINLVVGVLQVTRSGDAFLRPDHAADKDVFVPQNAQDSAMDGDRVAVRVEHRPKGRAPVGTVVKVLERAHPTVVGTFRATRNFGFVTPLDRRMSRDVLVPEGKGEGAKDGDVVVVRITQFGDRRLNAQGEVERVLGPMERPGVDVLAIVHAHGLPTEFPGDVERAAEDARDRARTPDGHLDRRDLHVFTIDPSDARDHDDALSVTACSDGKSWEVGIHIADVSHFVQEGSALDLEAYRRGTSVYLVDQVIPMLPHLLSSDYCSLKEGADRLVVSLFLTLDEVGRLREHRFERAWIQSAHGLDYERVHEVLAGRESVDEQTDESLRTLNRIALALRKRRRERGSLDFDLPEARVILDVDGVPVDVRRTVQLDSHRLIEDFMILANEVVASEAEKRRLPIPFRIHEPPVTDRTEDLRVFLSSVGQSLPRGKLKPKGLQAILDRTESRPEAALISTVILRSMARARYAVENEGHFGLASNAYTHFTSPIRRYPDLALHRVVVRCLVEGRPPLGHWGGESLDEMAARASERERIAQKAERDSIEMKKIEFMLRHLGDEFDGTISGVTSFGLFVTLDRYFVEGLIHVSSLGDDYYTFVQEAYSLVGERSKRRFRLADPVRVKVARADKEERRIDFVLLEASRGKR